MPYVKRNSRARVKPIGEPIYIRIIANRENRFHDTGMRVQKEDWNYKKHEVKASAPKAYEINHILAHLVINAKSMEIDLRMKGYNITADRMKYELDRGGGLELIPYFERVIEGFANNPKLASRYQHALDHLTGFRKNVCFTDLTTYFIREFDTYLRNEVTKADGSKLHINYVGKIHSWIRAVVNRALDDGATDISNPYSKFKVKTQFVESEFMSSEEFKRVEAADLFGKWEMARDFFLLSTYLSGMRANELLAAKKSDVEMREGVRVLKQHVSKTAQSVRRIKYCVIIPKAQKIIDRYAHWRSEYLLPYLETHVQVSSAIAKINALLKDVAQKAKVKPFTTKSARKTLINRLAGLKYSSSNIASFVGHESSATTEKHYIAYDMELQQKALSEAFD